MNYVKYKLHLYDCVYACMRVSGTAIHHTHAYARIRMYTHTVHINLSASGMFKQTCHMAPNVLLLVSDLSKFII